MPLPATANMALVLPQPGGDTGAWDSILNAALTLVDKHDHSSGKGVQVTPTGLNINANLPMGGNNLTGIGTLDFGTIGLPSTGARRLFFNAADGELYVRTTGGANVKITNGASLNIAIVGGIGGDYSSAGALVSYVDANGNYKMQQELSAGAMQWAGILHAYADFFEFRLHGDATNISNRVRLQSPTGLAANYALTFPGALPAAASPVYIDQNGIITSNQTTVTYAADFKNTANLTLSIPNQMADLNLNLRFNGGGEGRYAIQLSGGTGDPGLSTFPIPLRVGDAVNGWTLYLKKATDNTNTIRARLAAFVASSNSFLDLGAIGGQTNSANAPGYITLGESGAGAIFTVTAGTEYFLHVGMSAGTGTTDLVYHLEVSYQRP